MEFKSVFDKLNSEGSYFAPQSSQARGYDSKITVSFWILVLSFFAIVSRLFFLQVILGTSYKEQAQENTTYILTQAAPRGIIYDREHRVLASNKQSPSVVILPSIVLSHNLNLISRKLAQILNESPSKIKQELLKLNKNDAKPFTFRTNLTLEEVASIYENQFDLPGITVQQQSARHYVNGSVLAHVLGYTGEVNASEMKDNADRKFHDIVGKYGIEKVFDLDLRGENAYKRIRVNRHGQPVERIDLDDVSSAKSKSGKDITLTIDLDLQRVAEESMKNMNGAVVVSDIRTGEVLVLVSKPGFDPNLFTSKVSGQLWQEINSKQTFINRAISAYPPGSIWKPLVMLVALEKKVVKPGDKIPVSGAYYMGSTRFGDWTSATGIFTLQKALAWSRDTAFYRMAIHMSDKDITSWGKKFGAGQKTGIELQGESKGLVPDEKWKAKHLKSKWYPGYTLHYSIGQGYLLLTPVQVVRMLSGLATGNTVPRLHIVKQLGNQLPHKVSASHFEVSEAAYRVVREGMIECVDSGTCQATKLPNIRMAGKTGSAEAPPFKRTHGWYAGYAPVDNPEIAIVVFGEAAGHGGAVSAPVAKQVLLAYFKKYHGYDPANKEVNPALMGNVDNVQLQSPGEEMTHVTAATTTSSSSSSGANGTATTEELSTD